VPVAFTPARVTDACRLAPGVARITLGADVLAGVPPLPSGEVALRFPDDGGGLEERRYSVWRGDAGTGTLDVCVVLHGLGPGSRWAARARPGDSLEISLARTLPLELDASAGTHLFLGDETSVAAADALMRVALAGAVDSRERTPSAHDSAPPRLEACFEIASPDFRWPDEALVAPPSVRWTERAGRPGTALLAWLDPDRLPAADGLTVYVTGETWLCASVQSRLVRELGVAPGAVRALPFWKWRRTPALVGSPSPAT